MAEIKEAIELLEKIENKVSVPCHINTSRCGNCGECMWCWLKQVFILLSTAQEQPPASNFTKECRELRKKGATAEQLEYATKLGEACDIIDQLTKAQEQPPAGEFTKLARKAIVCLSLAEADEKGNIKDEKGVESSIEILFRACDRLDRSEAEIKSQVEHIKLLNQCDDSSTEVIGKMDVEIEQLEASRKELLTALERDAFLANQAILATPTGDLRNKLTELNILRLADIEKHKKGDSRRKERKL